MFGGSFGEGEGRLPTQKRGLVWPPLWGNIFYDPPVLGFLFFRVELPPLHGFKASPCNQRNSMRPVSSHAGIVMFDFFLNDKSFVRVFDSPQIIPSYAVVDSISGFGIFPLCLSFPPEPFRLFGNRDRIETERPHEKFSPSSCNRFSFPIDRIISPVCYAFPHFSDSAHCGRDCRRDKAFRPFP